MRSTSSLFEFLQNRVEWDVAFHQADEEMEDQIGCLGGDALSISVVTTQLDTGLESFLHDLALDSLRIVEELCRVGTGGPVFVSFSEYLLECGDRRQHAPSLALRHERWCRRACGRGGFDAVCRSAAAISTDRCVVLGSQKPLDQHQVGDPREPGDGRIGNIEAEPDRDIEKRKPIDSSRLRE